MIFIFDRQDKWGALIRFMIEDLGLSGHCKEIHLYATKSTLGCSLLLHQNCTQAYFIVVKSPSSFKSPCVSGHPSRWLIIKHKFSAQFLYFLKVAWKLHVCLLLLYAFCTHFVICLSIAQKNALNTLRSQSWWSYLSQGICGEFRDRTS